MILRFLRRAPPPRYFPAEIEQHLRELGLSPWAVPAEVLQHGG